MPDANALNYLALQDAVLGRRFPASSQRTNAKRWIATAYQDVWSADDWTFKRVSRASLTMTAGDTTPTMPADFGSAIELFDDSGNKLEYLSQERFERYYAADLVGSTAGIPSAYTVVNRQIEVSSAPGTATYKLSYYRRLSHKESDGTTVTAGFMNEDDDFPLWDDHHAVLIPRATAIGLIEVNDPTWQQAQEEYERQLQRMSADYEQPQPSYQWGAVSWSA
jgi:hypothetical protein